MKRPVNLVLLVGLTALNATCADETSTANEPITTAKNAATSSPQASPTAKTSSRATKEAGTTRVAVTLMAAPYSDAKQNGRLAPNSKVGILERRGGWLRVTADGKTGWVKMYQIRSGEGPEGKKSSEGLAMLKNIGQTGRSGSQGIVATTGIRGLSAEELKAAKPDPKAVSAMEAYRASDAAARDYARSAGLKDKDVPFLSKD